MLDAEERSNLLRLEGKQLMQALRGGVLTTHQKWSVCQDWLRVEGRNIQNDPSYEAILEKSMDLAEIVEKDAQLAEKDAQLAKQNAQLAEKDAQLKKLNAQLAKVRLSKIRKEFPARKDMTRSEPHWPSAQHRHATVREENNLEVALEIVRRDHTLADKFWEAEYLNDMDLVDSEGDAVYICRSVVKAVLMGLGLESKVDTVTTRTIAGVECDLLLIQRSNRLPFAVMEVKKPGNANELRDIIWYGKEDKHSEGKVVNRVAGQVFNQLKAIQLHGFSSVVGMISTGTQWRLVGLPDEGKQSSNDSTFVDSLKKKLCELPSKKGKYKKNSQDDSNNEPSPEQPIAVFDETLDGTTEDDKRVLLAGPILPDHACVNSDEELIELCKASGEKIVELVALWVVTSYSLLLQTSDLKKIRIGKMMPCRILRDPQNKIAKSRGTVSFGTVQIKELALHNFADSETAELYVIHPVGNGDNANVCLAIASKGKSCCVVKFYHVKADRAQLASVEETNWNKVYHNVNSFKARILDLEDGPCLVMPYLERIPKEDRGVVLRKGLIKRALLRVSDAGLKYTDIKWHHFVRRPKQVTGNTDASRYISQDREVYIIDMGSEGVTKKGSDFELSNWLQSCEAKLWARMNEEPDPLADFEIEPLTQGDILMGGGVDCNSQSISGGTGRVEVKRRKCNQI